MVHIVHVLIRSLKNFVMQLVAVPNLKIDYVVINAGVLRYPNVSAGMLLPDASGFL